MTSCSYDVISYNIHNMHSSSIYVINVMCTLLYSKCIRMIGLFYKIGFLQKKALQKNVLLFLEHVCYVENQPIKVKNSSLHVVVAVFVVFVTLVAITVTDIILLTIMLF
jgi:hypothetical protein